MITGSCLCVCDHTSTCTYTQYMQNQGLSAGRYYMRCPVCNDKDSYMQEMLKMGIAVPEKLVQYRSLVQALWFVCGYLS